MCVYMCMCVCVGGLLGFFVARRGEGGGGGGGADSLQK